MWSMQESVYGLLISVVCDTERIYDATDFVQALAKFFGKRRV